MTVALSPSIQKESVFSQEKIIRFFDSLWEINEKKMNSRTSIWWYGLFMIKGEKGFGPGQVMLAFSTTKGEFLINGRRTVGFKKIPEKGNPKYIKGFFTGWYFDGN